MKSNCCLNPCHSNAGKPSPGFLHTPPTASIKCQCQLRLPRTHRSSTHYLPRLPLSRLPFALALHVVEITPTLVTEIQLKRLKLQRPASLPVLVSLQLGPPCSGLLLHPRPDTSTQPFPRMVRRPHTALSVSSLPKTSRLSHLYHHILAAQHSAWHALKT